MKKKRNADKWTERDVMNIVDAGRAVGRRILGAYKPFLAHSLDVKAALFMADFQLASEAVRRGEEINDPACLDAIGTVQVAMIAEGLGQDIIEAHIEGALMLMRAGHSLEEAADLGRRH